MNYTEANIRLVFSMFEIHLQNRSFFPFFVINALAKFPTMAHASLKVFPIFEELTFLETSVL